MANPFAELLAKSPGLARALSKYMPGQNAPGGQNPFTAGQKQWMPAPAPKKRQKKAKAGGPATS